MTELTSATGPAAPRAGRSGGPRPVVGAALLDRLDGPTRLLVGRRSSPSSLAGLWEFPGGKVEPGEDPRSALGREVREELGVDIRLDREVEAGHPEGWLLGNGARMRVFTAVIEDGEARPLQDHDLLQWRDLDRDGLQQLEWIPADRPIVDALVEMLRDRPSWRRLRTAPAGESVGKPWGQLPWATCPRPRR